MVTPVARREAVAHLCQRYEVSQRRACTAIVAERSSVRYRSLRPDDDAVRAPASGTGCDPPAVRPSASACIAAPGGRAHEPQEAAAALNETLFTSRAHVREALAAWEDDYNTVRPHSAIGNQPPAIYAKLSVLAIQRDGTLRSLAGFASRPVAPPSPIGSNDERAPLIVG